MHIRAPWQTPSALIFACGIAAATGCSVSESDERTKDEALVQTDQASSDGDSLKREDRPDEGRVAFAMPLTDGAHVFDEVSIIVCSRAERAFKRHKGHRRPVGASIGGNQGSGSEYPIPELGRPIDAESHGDAPLAGGEDAGPEGRPTTMPWPLPITEHPEFGARCAVVTETTVPFVSGEVVTLPGIPVGLAIVHVELRRDGKTVEAGWGKARVTPRDIARVSVPVRPVASDLVVEIVRLGDEDSSGETKVTPVTMGE